MSRLVSAARTAITRPLLSSIVTVGLAFLAWYFLANHPTNEKPSTHRKMHIESIPMCKAKYTMVSSLYRTNAPTGEGSGNNYAYLVTDDKTKEAVIIDPANPPESVVIVCGQIITADSFDSGFYLISRKQRRVASK